MVRPDVEAGVIMANDGTEDDVCVGYPEHMGVRETYRGDDGITWECLNCGAEGWEFSDGIEFGAREVRAQ